MRILRHFENVPSALHHSVVAIGNFDGVHLGHRALIQEAAAQARALGVPLSVLSFEPHPQEYFRGLHPESEPSPTGGQEGGASPAGSECFRLTPLRVKARLLAELGVDALFALPFDAQMARRSPEQFVQEVLKNGLDVKGVVVGHDFEFGNRRAGNLAALSYMGKMEGFTVTPFDTVLTGVQGEKISSTRIRALLKQLVHAEDGRKPLSDSKISQILGDQGIVVARRTIAKYRESLNIPSVSLRKSL